MDNLSSYNFYPNPDLDWDICEEETEKNFSEKMHIKYLYFSNKITSIQNSFSKFYLKIISQERRIFFTHKTYFSKRNSDL